MAKECCCEWNDYYYLYEQQTTQEQPMPKQRPSTFSRPHS